MCDSFPLNEITILINIAPIKKFMKIFKIINIFLTIFEFLVKCDSFSPNKMTIFINIAPIKNFKI